ncbi:MAG: hypothetical protein F6K54_18155 [Okeania sp. SIO3B5]|uniref:hypothetical protein n=1 Tax=Okeania sp. SIO3B5 TaxID=2607811 RepID=UPI0013FF7201|nr:hypothetical protein [Okeania sp. SIO3B5]NEO54834.1 hypothetical protein [Okeania sp. SIO3B5]
MEASINVTLKLDNKDYNIDLGIPSGSPTNDSPYKFSVSTITTDTTDGSTQTETLLDLAVGGDDGSGTNFYVNLEPPQSVLPGDTIQDLAVNVQEGTYDTTAGTFSSQ